MIHADFYMNSQNHKPLDLVATPLLGIQTVYNPHEKGLASPQHRHSNFTISSVSWYVAHDSLWLHKYFLLYSIIRVVQRNPLQFLVSHIVVSKIL